MRSEVRVPVFFPLMASLCATAFAVAACLFLVGCSNEANRPYETGSITTGGIPSATSPVRPPKTAIVQSGDTLYSIARRNNVTVYDLMTVNGLTSSRVAVGQALNIPTY
jgi:LysM repeat protein